MSAENYYNSGNEKLKAGEYEEAIKDFSKALKFNGKYSAIYASRGWAYMRLELFADALNDFEKAIELDPENAHYYSESGVVKMALGSNNLAMIDFDFAIEKEPEYGYRYACRAFLKDKLGDFEGAISDYQKAIGLDSEDAVSLNNIGLIEEKIGRKKIADEHFKKADDLAKSQGLFGSYRGNESFQAEDKRRGDDNQNVSNLKIGHNYKENNGPKGLLKPIIKVFTSYNGFKEFISFVVNGFKIKE